MPIKSADFLDKLKNLEVDKIRIVLIIFIMLALGIFLFKPISKLLSRQAELSRDIKMKNIQARAIPGEQNKLFNEVAELERAWAAQTSNFISGPEEILLFINRTAEELKIAILNAEPLDKREIEIKGKEYAVEVFPLNIKIKCDYYQLVKFLKMLEKGDRLILVDDVRIKTDAADIWSHNVELELQAPIAINEKSK